MSVSDLRTQALMLAAALLVSAVLFSVWPGIDLWFSGLFFRPGEGFWLVHSAMLEWWRDTAWTLSILIFFLSLGGLALAVAGRHILGIGARVWGYIAMLYLIAPILLVDRGLKEFWGRARPASVETFGGPMVFTPALVPSDACSANCSFVSGEGSAAVALALSMFALVPALSHRLSPGWLAAWKSLAVLVAGGTLLQRIVTGRHFLSDSLFAVLFVLSVSVALRWIFQLSSRHRT